MPESKRNTDSMSDIDIRENFSDLFSRIGRLEMDSSANAERDVHILNGIKDIKESFRIHDEKEMIKYDKIISQISSIKKYAWLVLGAITILEILHKFNLIKFNF